MTRPDVTAFAAVTAPDVLMAEFSAYLDRRTDRLADTTADGYRAYLRAWFAYAAAHRVDPLAPEAADIERWASLSPVADRKHLSGPRDRRPSTDTVRQRLAALTSFYDWTTDRGLSPSNLARALPRPSRPRGHGQDTRRLTPAEIAATLAAARDDSPPAYAVVRALADLGIRGTELRTARICDYRPGDDDAPHLYVTGKGGHRTARRLPAVTVDAINDAISWRKAVAPYRSGTHQGGPLFASPKGHYRHGVPAALDAHRFQSLLRRVLRASGVERPEQITAQAYRHAWVRHGVASGWPVTDVQEEIGHAALSSTLHYLIGGTGTLHPLASTIRPLTTFVAESVVMLRAVSGGEASVVAAELAGRLHEADTARRELDTLRELHAARTEAAGLRAEAEQMRLRLAALDSLTA